VRNTLGDIMTNKIAWETWIFGLLLGLAAMGCDMLGSDTEKQEQAQQLAACRGDASDAEVQENILITEEYAQGVAADLALCWRPVLFALDFTLLWAQTLGAVPSTEPVGWTFEDSTYRYGSDTAAIEMRVFLSEDLQYGPAGTQVLENILDVDSYLVNAAFEADTDAGTVTITFDEPGPLAELLGLGAAPTSPVTLDELGQAQAVESLSTLALEVDYVAYGVTQSTLVDYHAVSPATPIATLVADGPLPVEFVTINAYREALDQTLTTTVWDVVREGGVITGYTTFEVSGGYFPYGGRIDFQGIHLAVIADRELYCL
jgi:hypothetical protein